MPLLFMKILHFRLISLLLFFSVSFSGQAQEDSVTKDSVTVDISLNQTLSSQNYLPHYLAANRFGVLDFADDDVSWLNIRSEGRYSLLDKLELIGGLQAIGKAGIDEGKAYDAFLQQAYAGIRFHFLQFTAGRMERTLGTTAGELSSGSLALSQNARPMPMLLISVPEYTDVPFTKGYLQFKGTYAHGWFGEERFMTNALLHEKSFYLRGGGKKAKIYAGLVHLVVWGGEHPTFGEAPASFDDYLRVISSSAGVNLNADGGNPIYGEQKNVLGDNLGIFDFGAESSLGFADLLLYYQIPYADWSGTRFWRNKDQLAGISLKNKTDFQYISGFAYEYLNTKFQSGPGFTDPQGNDPNDNFGYDYGGRDNYYNNYLYRSGWTYQDRILGTPLFFTKARMQYYVPGFEDPDINRFDFNIVNNRIIAHHFGIKGRISPQIEYGFLATFSKNYGTYGGLNGGIGRWESITNPDLEYAFKPPLRQNYFLLEVTTPLLQRKLELHTSIAVDRGELTNNFGIMAGLRWKQGWYLKGKKDPSR